jgi:cytochrome b
MKIFKTSFWIAVILSFGYMAWQAVSHKGLACGFLKMEQCGTTQWLGQVGIMFVILLVVLILIFGIITRKRTRFGFVRGKIGEDIEKKKKMHKELGVAEIHQLHTTKKLRKGKIRI